MAENEKCFCHLNGLAVKDATARKQIEEIMRDHPNNTGVIDYLTALAENPENDGKVYGIKDETIVPMDAPTGGGTTIHTFDNVDEMNAANLPDGSIALVPSEESAGGGGLPVVELSQETMSAIFSEGESNLTEAEHAILYKAMQNLSPVVIKGNFNGMVFSGVSNIYVTEEYANYFSADTGLLEMRIAVGENGGIIKMFAE